MARGRKPKPIEQKVAEGNRGRRPLPEPVRTGAPLPAEPPDTLGDAGRELWIEMTTRLAGILDAIDRAALTAMCQQADRAAAADKVIREQGHFARGSTGQVVAHPALGIERAAHALLLRFAAEYAATPVARARVAAARDARKEQYELDQLTSGGAVEIGDVVDLDAEEL